MSANPQAKKIIGFLGAYILLAVLLSYPYLTSQLVADPDAYGRVLQAWLPMQSGHFWDIQPDGQWLPAHGLILRMGWLVWPDFFNAPRYLTFLISLAGIPLFYLFCRRLLTEWNALIATFLFTILPLRYILSTQPLTEGALLPFLLLPLIAIADNKNMKWLGWGIAGLSVGMGIRYEAWLLLPFMWFIIVSRVSNPLARITALLSTIIVPVTWILATHHYTGRWIFFLYDRINLAGPSMQYLVHNPYTSFHAILTALLAIIPGPLFILIFIGTYIMLHNSNPKGYTATKIVVLLPWYHIMILYLLIFFGAMEWITPRFFLFISVLFLPPLVSGFKFLYSLSRIFFWAILLILILTLPSYVSRQQASLTYGALLGITPQKKYSAAWEVIRFINNNKSYRFRYVTPADGSADFLTMISYYAKSDLFITAYLPPEKTTDMVHLIVEKDIQKYISTSSGAVINNEYFSIHPKATE